jgi:hypothetical protein
MNVAANRLETLLQQQETRRIDRTGDAPAMAFKELELRFASTLVDAALPKSKSMFGGGVGGTVAREALVNSLASSVASNSALGIARMLCTSPSCEHVRDGSGNGTGARGA